MPERSTAADRVLGLLELLAEHPDGLSVQQAAARLDLSRPVVYRLLATLVDRGYARRSATGTVAVGASVWLLAQRAQQSWRRTAVPVLRRLAEESGATAHLTLADGDEAVAVAVVEPSWTDLHVGYRAGSRHPLDRGAAGRAILAVRSGAPALVATAGELRPGASGLAVAVLTPALEASVGLVALQPLDADALGPVLQAAAARLAAQLG